MGIDEFLRGLDNPRATIAYPQKVIHKSDTGHPVYGLDPTVQALVRQGQPLVPPLQVVRRPGLGDKVFSLAATFAYLQEHPDLDVTFSGLDTDKWLELIPWVKIGVNPECSTVANLDNTPPNGGDRTKLMGEVLGIDVTSMEFPIRTPRMSLGVKKPYYVFVPFAARCGPRSLPLQTTLEVMKSSPVPLAIVDSLRYDWCELGSNVTNCTGMDMFQLVALLAECEGIVSCDTGVPWLGAAMGKPCVVLFSHVPMRDRTMTCRNVLGVEPQIPCFNGCGDHVATRPECRWREQVNKCTAGYTAEFVRHMMREFAGLT